LYLLVHIAVEPELMNYQIDFKIMLF